MLARAEEEKRKVALQVQQEKKARAVALAKREEEEMIKRKKFIQEIQAMEKLTNQRAKRPRYVSAPCDCLVVFCFPSAWC